MGDNTPSPILPPPPPHQSSPKFTIPFLYYGLAVVTIAALVLVVYNLIIVRWCAYHSPTRTTTEITEQESSSSSQSFDNPNNRLISSFKYKRENKTGKDHNEGCEYECTICLSVFEEGEDVRQMSRCKHSFHAPCIDMWLSSHANCPVCRAPLEPPNLHRNLAIDQTDNSRERFLHPNLMV